MRKALLLLPLLLLLALLPLPAPAAPAAPPAPVVVDGPLLTPPNPAVYPVSPFVLAPSAQPVSVRPAEPTETVLGLLVEFDDAVASQTRAGVDDLLFGTGPGDATVNRYYWENSYGQTEVVGDLSPDWYTMPEPMTYYGEDGSGIDDGNGPIYCLTVEAVLAADDDVDFAQYDTDDDGVVDHLIVVHAGPGQETSTNTDLIWSHRWAVIDASRCGNPTRSLVVDGVRVDGYLMTSETAPLGVYVHELGHNFGLPDLYDTTGSTQGIGEWGVMGTGSWNGAPRGVLPAHFMAWSKAQLGWLELTEVTQPLLPAEISPLATNPVAFRLSVHERELGDEYFVVANRQPMGFDAGLPGAGLLIWHVDESQRNNDRQSRRLVDLEEADDGRGPLFEDTPTQGTDAWAEDPDGFSSSSVPNSYDRAGVPTGWKVTDIGPSQERMTANISKGVALDLAVLEIERPRFVPLNQSVDLRVQVENRGLAVAENGSLTLTLYHEVLDDAAQVFQEVQELDDLEEGGVTAVAFAFVPDRAGRYLAEAHAALEGDEFPGSNVRLASFRAGQHLFRDDLEGGVSDWTATDPGASAFRWELVEDGDGFGTAYSPTHAWRFGFFGSGVVPAEPPTLTVPAVSLDGADPWLLFRHRYELGTPADETTGEVGESDRGTVEVSVDGGPWAEAAAYEGVQETWEAAAVNLTPFVDGGDVLRIRFGVGPEFQPDGGGWWIDDVVVATVPLGPAGLLRPLDTQKEVSAGETATFDFLLANVGDLESEFRFQVEGIPSDWTTAIGQNLTTATPVAEFRPRLGVDDHLFLTLWVTSHPLAERGSLHEGVLRVLTPDDAETGNFAFSVQVPLEFGLNLSGETLAVALLVGGIMLALAVVLTALRRRRTY